MYQLETSRLLIFLTRCLLHTQINMYHTISLSGFIKPQSKFNFFIIVLNSLRRTPHFLVYVKQN